MESVFRSFCSFGADKGVATPLMDGSKLVKLCRDQQLFDKNLTQTDVDIVFSKVKPKTERKINFKQFEDALKMIAEKKFPGTEDSLEKLKAKILEGGGPMTHGVTRTLKTGAVERLSDSQRGTASGGTASPAKDSKEIRKGSATKKPRSTPTPAGSESSPRVARTPARVKRETESAKTAAAAHDKTTPDPEPAENGAIDTPSPGPAEPDHPPSGADVDAKAVADEKEELLVKTSDDNLLDFAEEQDTPNT